GVTQRPVSWVVCRPATIGTQPDMFLGRGPGPTHCCVDVSPGYWERLRPYQASDHPGVVDQAAAIAPLEYAPQCQACCHAAAYPLDHAGQPGGRRRGGKQYELIGKQGPAVNSNLMQPGFGDQPVADLIECGSRSGV